MTTQTVIVLIVLLIVVVTMGIVFFALGRKMVRIRPKDITPQIFTHSIEDLLSIIGGKENVASTHAQLNTVWIDVRDDTQISWKELKRNFHFRCVEMMRSHILVIRTEGCAEDISNKILKFINKK